MKRIYGFLAVAALITACHTSLSTSADMPEKNAESGPRNPEPPAPSTGVIGAVAGSGLAAVMDAQQHVQALSRTTQPTLWYYFQHGSTGWWYIVSLQGYIYMLDAVGSQYPGRIGWRPINAPTGQTLSFQGYPTVGTSFGSVSIAPDGQSVTIGGATKGGLPSHASAIEGSVQQISWLYFRNASTGWYITEASSASSVYFLEAADPSISGGIGWQPVYQGSYAGYADAGRTFSSVSLGQGRRSTVFGSAAGNSNEVRFSWPTDPATTSPGFFGTCGDNPGPQGCFWLSTAGWRDANPFMKFRTNSGNYHLGADWNLGSGSADSGLNVYAAGDGNVSEVLEGDANLGNAVFVLHSTSGGSFTSVYAHLEWSPTGPPKRDAPISRGQRLGLIGKTGAAGPYEHLHFEVRLGKSITPGKGYAPFLSTVGPQGQIDPNAFISSRR